MKYCAEDGSWFAKSGREWTDFTPCVDKQVSDVTYIPFLHRDAEKKEPIFFCVFSPYLPKTGW